MLPFFPFLESVAWGSSSGKGSPSTLCEGLLLKAKGHDLHGPMKAGQRWPALTEVANRLPVGQSQPQTLPIRPMWCWNKWNSLPMFKYRKISIKPKIWGFSRRSEILAFDTQRELTRNFLLWMGQVFWLLVTSHRGTNCGERTEFSSDPGRIQSKVKEPSQEWWARAAPALRGSPRRVKASFVHSFFHLTNIIECLDVQVIVPTLRERTFIEKLLCIRL